MGDSKTVLNYNESEFTDRVESEGFGPEGLKLYQHLTSRVLGQERASRGVANGMSLYYAALNDPTKPLGVFLYSGPTGTGKTLMAEETARFLIGDALRAPLTRIPCAKYSERHRVSELIGSPPGYVDSNKQPILSQILIDEPHFRFKVQDQLKEAFDKRGKKSADDVMLDLYEKNKPYLSVLLFDEVEKAHPDLHSALLHIIDDGELALPQGNITSFANSIICLTCNIGGREQQEMLTGKAAGMGFGRADKDVAELSAVDAEALDQEIYKKTVDEIGKLFSPELVGRIKDGIVVFRTLSREQQRSVLDLMLSKLQDELSGRNDARAIPLTLRFDEAFKEFLLEKGESRKYGLRPLKGTVKKYVRLPLGNAISSGDVRAADELLFKVQNGQTVIFRKKRPELVVKGLSSPKR